MDGYIVSVPGYICFGIVAHGFWHVEQVRQIARIAWLIGDSDVFDRRGGAASGIDDLPGDEKSGSIVPVGVGFEIPLIVPAVFELRVWIDNWDICVYFQIIEQFTAAGRSVRCGEAIREEFAVYAFFIGGTQEDKFGAFFFPGVRGRSGVCLPASGVPRRKNGWCRESPRQSFRACKSTSHLFR